MERTRVLSLLTHQLGQPTSGHLNASEIRMRLPTHGISQLIDRVVVTVCVSFFPLEVPKEWHTLQSLVS